jgi:hypothetical protein
MYRIVIMGSGLYAKEIDGITDEEIEDINEFVRNGEPVILCNDFDDLERIGIEEDDIIMVKDE